MDRAVLTVTPENIITIGLMMVGWFLVSALAVKAYRNYSASSGGAS